MKKFPIIILFLCTIVITAVGTYAAVQWFETGKIFKDVDGGQKEDTENFKSGNELKNRKTYQLIQESYYEDVESEQLIEGAVQGMLTALDDPYSVYMNEKKSRQFNSSLDSSFEGIGAEISEVDGKFIIVAPFKNSPAEKAGIRPHDQIIKVDGEDIAGKDLYDVTLLIRGKRNHRHFGNHPPRTKPAHYD